MLKLGLSLSAGIVLFLGGVGFFAYWGLPDPPTDTTSDQKLSLVTLPNGLAAVFEPTVHQTETYEPALRFFHQYQVTLAYDPPPPALADQLADLLINAMHHDQVPAGFLDDSVPLRPNAQPQFGDALEWVPRICLTHAIHLYEQGHTTRAHQITQAVWALGQRAYELNGRLYIRWLGLTIMQTAGDQLYQWLDPEDTAGHAHLKAWAKALRNVSQAWWPKYYIVLQPEPPVGDLVNIARNDRDQTFRVDAILRLGVIQFNPGNRGNRRVIRQTLTHALDDPDPWVAQAARAARAHTP